MAYVTPEQHQEALLAKLLWASIGAGVDVGLTDDQLVRAFQPETIRKVAALARKAKQDDTWPAGGN